MRNICTHWCQLSYIHRHTYQDKVRSLKRGWDRLTVPHWQEMVFMTFFQGEGFDSQWDFISSYKYGHARDHNVWQSRGEKNVMGVYHLNCLWAVRFLLQIHTQRHATSSNSLGFCWQWNSWKTDTKGAVQANAWDCLLLTFMNQLMVFLWNCSTSAIIHSNWENVEASECSYCDV